MSIFRDSPSASAPLTMRARFFAGIACALMCVGCTPAARELRQRPDLLARDWFDAKKSTPTDTSVWRLATSGGDFTLHIMFNHEARGAAARVEKLTRHGIWYLHGTLVDSAHTLCFKRRPSRAAASCIPFVLDTLADGRLKLTLQDYVGTHETASRTLIERRF